MIFGLSIVQALVIGITGIGSIASFIAVLFAINHDNPEILQKASALLFMFSMVLVVSVRHLS